jgi:hypothetical protein
LLKKEIRWFDQKIKILCSANVKKKKIGSTKNQKKKTQREFSKVKIQERKRKISTGCQKRKIRIFNIK